MLFISCNAEHDSPGPASWQFSRPAQLRNGPRWCGQTPTQEAEAGPRATLSWPAVGGRASRDPQQLEHLTQLDVVQGRVTELRTWAQCVPLSAAVPGGTHHAGRFEVADDRG